MKVDPTTGAPVPALSGEDLTAAVPKLKEIANVRVVEFSNIPSDYMGPDRWPSLTMKVEEVLADPSVAGAVSPWRELSARAISRRTEWFNRKAIAGLARENDRLASPTHHPPEHRASP
jgi:hypothetical protein